MKVITEDFLRELKKIDSSIVALYSCEDTMYNRVCYTLLRSGKKEIFFSIDRHIGLDHRNPYRIQEKAKRIVVEKLLKELPYMDRKVRMMYL